ncbi:class I SAM-dependent methyltransferase [Bacillus sp. Marseille-Q1617]|uniref:class I SAM-dependent methyltransferase n=1 Tax=Bacillus sp. Marseille-Q1617 TaxID=2736887 RepID=UPI00158DE768|nr:class I SAM-dependent methyltransferase [Bacillus sp. Marseille-Q1617]
MDLKTTLQQIMDNQYGRPRGVLGWLIGEKMIRQHKLETLWTLHNLQLQKNQHILEVGCGAGFAFKQISSMNGGQHVTGLDLSKTLLHSAAIRNRKALKQKRMELVPGSVEELPFPDEQFSAVFSIHSVYFWENLFRSFEEIHRVLTPGGTVMITLCDGKDGEDWDSVKHMIHRKLMPVMEILKFSEVSLVCGPVSRGYQTVAVIAVK